MYDLRKLEILFELSQLGSLAQVADTLGYNPSTVSQHLASLQREVGQPLVEKNGRGVVLTAQQLTPTPRFISTDLAWQLDLAEQGLAATVLPQLVLAHRNVSDRVWVSGALGARSVFAAVRASSMHDPAIRLVLNELKSAKRTK